MKLKLLIRKLKVFNERFTRYYSVEHLQVDTEKHFTTEGQLAYYIYLKHGTGRFIVLAFKKGKKGFWKYWNGDILDNGFVRDKDKNKEMDTLKKELHQAKSYEERENIEEEIDLEREIKQEEKKTKRPQCYGLIKSRPGQLNEYHPLN